ncbi:MAG: DNA polymerase III subunit delta [Planctomycetes bacterium]|nr:DNA polymerase III subunit delta [Planctomycetota bacterium]
MARGKSGKPADGIRLSEFEKTSPAKPLPIYVLKGTDPYLLEHGRAHVRKIAIGDADPGLAVLDVLGPDAVLADVMDALRTLPFLAPRRLVVIRDAEEFLEKPARKDDKVRDVLVEYLDAPSPTGTLCLEAASWNTSTTLHKRVVGMGALVLCELADPGSLPGWLMAQARHQHKKKLSAAAAQMLVEHLGTDFASLLSALDALALYAGREEAIEADDVDALVARGHHERVWALCDAAAERNVSRAMELLDAFLAEGMVAPQIIGLLRPTYKQLLRIKALARRTDLPHAMDEARVNYYARDRVRRALAAMSGAHLAAAYQALVDADLQAKTTPNERVVLETLIHRLCLPEALGAVAAGRGSSE